MERSACEPCTLSTSPPRRVGPRGLLCSGVLFLLAGCAPEDAASPSQSALSGQDGALAVTTQNTVVNRYAVLAADAAAGSRTLNLRSAASLLPLLPGDLLLVIQMQGAQIDGGDSVKYGAVTSLAGAGRFELVTVASLSGNSVTLDPACQLRNDYSAAGRAQVVRVPQLSTLSVTAGASVSAPPWDGASGGVVALRVEQEARIDGALNATGRGFRGGRLHNMTGPDDGKNVIYRAADAFHGAEKGESIAGGAQDYDALSGRYGRGAPANGGGGGDAHNGGGGGGANGANGLLGDLWTGEGVMDGALVGATAWKLDPGYVANGNRLTRSSGGGRGGYSFSHADAEVGVVPDPLVMGPGDAAWGGDLRREVGGLGGHPVQNDPSSRLFLGGGGGAGDENDSAGSPGGSGGGLILLYAGSVSGGGQIVADGADAAPTSANNNDGVGGGGGGGTVVVYAQAISGISVSAGGGQGGKQLPGQYLEDNHEAEGPGGGGGGGYIAIPASAAQAGVQTHAASGSAGTSGSSSVAKFPQNGATAGAPGQAAEIAPAQPPLCPAGQADLGQGQGTRYVGGCSTTAGRGAAMPAPGSRSSASSGATPGPVWLLGLLGLLLCLPLFRQRVRVHSVRTRP